MSASAAPWLDTGKASVLDILASLGITIMEQSRYANTARHGQPSPITPASCLQLQLTYMYDAVGNMPETQVAAGS